MSMNARRRQIQDVPDCVMKGVDPPGFDVRHINEYIGELNIIDNSYVLGS